jgi:hypothetical protein
MQGLGPFYSFKYDIVFDVNRPFLAELTRFKKFDELVEQIR